MLLSITHNQEKLINSTSITFPKLLRKCAKLLPNFCRLLKWKYIIYRTQLIKCYTIQVDLFQSHKH